MVSDHKASDERNFSIAVVGGGIGGLCTVIGLLQQGVDVEIYEGVPRATILSRTRQSILTAMVGSRSGLRRDRRWRISRTECRKGYAADRPPDLRGVSEMRYEQRVEEQAEVLVLLSQGAGYAGRVRRAFA